MSHSAKAERQHGKALRWLRKGALAERFYVEFHLDSSGTCPLQRPDGLCSLQMEKRPNALPFVCQSFPRLEHYESSCYYERSLSPSCKGVLELLWDLPEGVDFMSDPLPKELVKHVNFRNPDSIAPHFQKIRSQCNDFLQDRRFTLPERIFLVGLALKELTDGETDVDRWLTRACAMAELPGVMAPLRQMESDRKDAPMHLSNNIKVLLNLDSNRSDFDMVTNELCAALGMRFEGCSGQATIPAAYAEA